jgi:hypothetical protein
MLTKSVCGEFDKRRFGMTTNPDYQKYEKKISSMRALEVEAFAYNKTILFDALSAAGIASVIVAFDGANDSGQIESIDAYAADESHQFVPEGSLEWSSVLLETLTIQKQQMSLVTAVETIAYDLLSNTYGGWGNDDGAYGEFTFLVDTRIISLAFNERYIETNTYTNEF